MQWALLTELSGSPKTVPYIFSRQQQQLLDSYPIDPS